MKKIGLILALIAIATVSCEKLDIRPDYEKGKKNFNMRSGEDTDADDAIVDPNQDEDEDIELEIVDPNNDEDEDKGDLIIIEN